MRYLFLLLLLAFLLLPGTCVRAQCPTDPDVTLSSQLDVDIYVLSFPNCATLGNLTIDGNDIDDISGLTDIVTLSGNLTVANTLLTDLSGLAGLASIGGDLTITDNANLASCDLDPICSLVLGGTATATVSGNTGDCADLATVTDECSPACHPDYDALMAFYDAMNGPNWLNRTGWEDGAAGTDCDVCSWWGVSCIFVNGISRVRALSFGVANGLVGVIPPEIGELTELGSVFFKNNPGIGGALPAELFSGTQLIRLDIQNSGITGLPSNLGDATGLTDIDLRNSPAFSGPIPASIGQLTQLTDFAITGADITAPLPANFAPPGLRAIRIIGTTLPGPLPDWSGLTALEFYNVYDNPQLTGPLPDLSNATPLRSFNAYDNAHDGPFPTANPSGFGQLITFDINGNEMTGAPPNLPGALSLGVYKIGDNNFSGTIDGPLFPSLSVSTVDMSDNDLSGLLPPFIGTVAPNVLIINGNQFAGCYPQEWVGICNAGFGQKNFSNPGLPAGGNTTWFFDNVCGEGQFCDDCHPDFGALVTLYSATDGPNWTDNTGWADGAVGADCNPCAWVGVTCVAGRVTELDLDQNGLSGFVPDNIGDLTELTELRLSRNDFAGSALPDLSPLSNLEVLRLNGSAFGGTLPALGSMVNLATLNLADNAFTGMIPPAYDVSNLPALAELYLNENQLSGDLPATLGDLPNLEEFIIHDNDLSGCYPASFTGFCGLVLTEFFNNPDLPDGGSADFFSNTFCPNGTNPCGTVCPPGDVTLTSPQDLADFRAQFPNCTELTGSLTIEGPNVPAAGFDLSGIVSIGGDLVVNDAAQNTSSAYLGEITSVAGDVTLQQTGFANLDGLTGIVGPIGDLNLLDNDQLTDLSGIGGGSSNRGAVLTTVENLRVIGNDQLTDLTSFGDFTINQALFIINNPGLSTCEATPVCDQISGSGSATITANATGCASTTEVEAACLALPVTWVDFTATARQKSVDLAWTTAAEEQNAGFTVQRSADGRAWRELTDLAPVPADATGLRHYAHADLNPPAGDLLYRIRQADLDGTVSYSPVRRVAVIGASASVAPNPAGGDFTISSPDAQAVIVYATDGRVVRTIRHTGARTQVQREGLRSGVYWLRFSASGEAIKLVIR